MRPSSPQNRPSRDARSGEGAEGRVSLGPLPAPSMAPAGCRPWRSPAAREAPDEATCCGSSVWWATRGTGVGEGDDDAVRDPKEVLRFPAGPTTRRPPTAGTKGYEGTGRGDLPCGERHLVVTSCEVTPSSRMSDTDVHLPLVHGLRATAAEGLDRTSRFAPGHGVSRVGPQRLRGLAPGDGTGEPGGGVGAGELPRRRGRRTAAAHWGGLPDRRHRGAGHGVPRRAPVRRGVRAGGCAGAGRGPLCQGNMRALPLAVPLPGEAGPACGGLRPQGGPGEGELEGRRRAEATDLAQRYAIRAGIEGSNPS